VQGDGKETQAAKQAATKGRKPAAFSLQLFG